MASNGSFSDLRELADWLSPDAATRAPAPRARIERLTRRLGVTALPLLGRALRGADPECREIARAALACLAADDHARERVIEAARAAALDAPIDDAKLCALGLLAELGEHALVRFADPSAMQRRSTLVLAAQLDTPAGTVRAADAMVRRLDEDEIGHMMELLVEVAPAAAHRLARELRARRDLSADFRARIATTTLARAVELLASGDPAAARALLARCNPALPDVAGTLAACFLVEENFAAAVEPLGRAIAADPHWPLHHWNLAIALQRLGDAAGCDQALRRFVATSAAPSAVAADPDQPARLACAARMLTELERIARLQRAPRRRRATSRQRQQPARQRQQPGPTPPSEPPAGPGRVRTSP